MSLDKEMKRLFWQALAWINHSVAAAVFSFAIFLLPGGLIAQSSPAGDGSKNPSGITIHQEISFKASPKQLYETLVSSKKFSECIKKSFDNFSAASANIDPSPGGAFSLFDGVICGRIVELVPNERIVEAWRVANWPPGLYSIARFELKPRGTGTLLVFDHTGFPDGAKASLSSGWQEHYWDTLKKYLE